MSYSLKTYSPEYDGPIAGYVVNHLQANYWRVASSMEREEVLQEAYLTFLRCKKLYPDVEEAKHFMALFKTAWYRQFNDLSNRDTKLRVEVPLPTMRDDEGHEREIEMVGELENDGLLAITIQQAPSEVKAVLTLFLSAPQELLELALSAVRAGNNKHLCRMLGLNKNIDVIRMTEEYFTQ